MFWLALLVFLIGAVLLAHGLALWVEEQRAL